MPHIIYSCPPDKSEISFKSVYSSQKGNKNRQWTLERTQVPHPDPDPQATADAEQTVENQFRSLETNDPEFRRASNAFYSDSSEMSQLKAEDLIRTMLIKTANECNKNNTDSPYWISIT